MFTMVSTTFACQTSPIHASERAVSEYQGLIGSHSGKRKYQHLSNFIAGTSEILIQQTLAWTEERLKRLSPGSCWGCVAYMYLHVTVVLMLLCCRLTVPDFRPRSPSLHFNCFSLHVRRPFHKPHSILAAYSTARTQVRGKA